MSGQRNSNGKRSYSHSDRADNDGGKRRNPPTDDKDTYAPSADDTVYRYLCPVKRIGSIIGRGGEIVKQLRADTHAKIRIGETMVGCDERIIMIFSARKESGDYLCPAQDALFRVHERLVSDEAHDDEETNNAGPTQVTVRMLVPSDQIGCIIGKAGQIVQGIRSDTGAQIRIVKNELPVCALSSDELVQISGEPSVVKKALKEISSRLHNNPSRTQPLLASNMSQVYPQGGHYGALNPTTPIMGMAPLVGAYGGYKGEPVRDWPPVFAGPREEGSAKEFGLRILCTSGNIGGVIGKGGGIIKQIRQESGASIKVDSSSAEDDCIISISSKEYFEDPVSPAIDAAIRLQPRCSDRSEKDSGEPSFTTRLLVPTSRIGCLIGKGGSIITEMRRTTRANIRVLSKEHLPKVAEEDDEMVQISGELDVTRNALLQITTRLRANFFEKEGVLSPYPPAPYHPLPTDSSDGPRYGGRDSSTRSYSYSGGYSGRYSGLSGAHSPDGYGSYSGSQGGSTNYGVYGGYSGRTGSAGLSGPHTLTLGKHHGY